MGPYYFGTKTMVSAHMYIATYCGKYMRSCSHTRCDCMVPKFVFRSVPHITVCLHFPFGAQLRHKGMIP